MRSGRWCITALAVALVAASALCSEARAAARVFQTPCIPGQAAPICFAEQGKVVAIDDGDTVDVRIPGAGTHRVRLTGINATEQTVYTSNPDRQRGECHALNATYLLTTLIARSHGQVRLVYQNRLTRAGQRLRRDVQVFVRGSWHDAGALLVSRGEALWLPSGIEWASNREYSFLSQQAAANGIGLFDTSFCGFGPDQDIPIHLRVNANAPGDDTINLNGEWVRVFNDGARPLTLAGWWVRDSATKRFHFPPGTVIPPGGKVTVHVGRGTNTPETFYWNLHYPIFENPTNDERAMGDGAYLFDPDGDLRAWKFYPCRVEC